MTADGAHAVLHALGDSHLVEECSGHSNHNNKAFLQLTACYFFLFFFFFFFSLALNPFVSEPLEKKTGRSGGQPQPGQANRTATESLMTNHQ